MHVLVTNDDGIHSPGLAALAKAAAALGEVTVVAPAVEQSGVGLTITYRHPLMFEEVHRPDAAGRRALYGYAVHGSPADCAKLGVLELGPALRGSRPDIALSGINLGANVGHGVLYSGTVAGAIEAAFHGVTSLAVSSVDRDPDDWDALARYAVDVAGRLAKGTVKAGSLWNLNLPAGPPRGLKAVRCSPDRRGDLLERRDSPEGRPYYWTGMDPATAGSPAPDTDAGAVAAGFASLTPLRYDLTDPAGFDTLRALDLSRRLTRRPSAMRRAALLSLAALLPVGCHDKDEIPPEVAAELAEVRGEAPAPAAEPKRGIVGRKTIEVLDAPAVIAAGTHGIAQDAIDGSPPLGGQDLGK